MGSSRRGEAESLVGLHTVWYYKDHHYKDHPYKDLRTIHKLRTISTKKEPCQLIDSIFQTHNFTKNDYIFSFLNFAKNVSL